MHRSSKPRTNEVPEKPRSQTRDFDCVVIGGGPGGLVSALYLKRFRRKTVLINAGKPRASWIPKTHNLMGFPDGISGKNLIARLHSQIGELKVPVIKGEAQATRHRSGFQIEVGGKLLTSKKLIIATGINDVEPEIDNLIELRKRGLLRYCPICDGYEYRHCQITVLANSNHGVQVAMSLAWYGAKVQLVIPDDFKLAPQRVQEIKLTHTRIIRGEISAIQENEEPQGIWIRFKDGRSTFSRVAYVALGCQVKDSAFKKIRGLRRSTDGFIITSSEQRTSVKGLFAVGDCVNTVGQIVIAAGQAALAATTVHNDLLEF